MSLLILRYILDTNVLVYFHDKRDAAKHTVARDLVRRLGMAGNAAIPVQVLAEFSNVALRKLSPPLDASSIYAQVEDFKATFPILPLTAEVVLEALRGVRDYRMSYYDAQIWAAARVAHVPVILSEDFNTGATIEGVTFVNPFAPDAEEIT